MQLYLCNFKSVQRPGEKDKETIHRVQPHMLYHALHTAHRGNACFVPAAETAAAAFDMLQEEVPELTVLRTPEGKPFLPDYPEFHYNFSDSGNYLVLAVSFRREIGVDLQRMTAISSDAEVLARRFFHPSDASRVLACSKETRPALFFRIWSIQEAYLKCIGKGLSWGLNHQFVNFENNSIGCKHFQELLPPEEGYWLTVCE